MKELSTEEKVKRYDEVIAMAKEYITRISNETVKEYVLNMFPELREPEDVRIRKDLIKWMEDFPDLIWRGHYKEDILAWLKKQSEPQVRTGIEWVNTIDDACDKRYSEEYAEGEYCHEQSFKWGFQEGVEWLGKQGGQKEINLVEVLKHYPRETELYSPLYGKLWLAEVDEKCEIITCYRHPLDKGCTRAILKQEHTVSFFSNGTTGLPDCTVSEDCMLFLYDIEKQSKKPQGKPALESINKVEPKFKVGDWVVLTAGELSATLQIADVDICNKLYWLNDGSYLCFVDEECLHLWTIKDAKDGDVLAWDDSKCLALFKAIYDKDSFKSHGFVGHHTGTFESGSYFHDIEGAHPTTKEQRDLLFQRMKESGYEWKETKKKLIKL